MKLAERVRRFDEADLYVVITEAFCAGRSAEVVLREVLAAGVRLVQLREKELDGRPFYERALAFRRLTREAGALLVVNDRLDIALAAGADGVHLGQEDLPPEAARRIAPELLVGVSTHSLDEALAAQEAGAGYVNVGPIFATQTKSVPTGALGPEAISTIAPHLRIPWSTMGGIKPENVDRVLARGARHPAVVTAVTAAADVTRAAAELRERILAHRA